MRRAVASARYLSLTQRHLSGTLGTKGRALKIAQIQHTNVYARPNTPIQYQRGFSVLRTMNPPSVGTTIQLARAKISSAPAIRAKPPETNNRVKALSGAILDA